MLLVSSPRLASPRHTINDQTNQQNGRTYSSLASFPPNKPPPRGTPNKVVVARLLAEQDDKRPAKPRPQLLPKDAAAADVEEQDTNQATLFMLSSAQPTRLLEIAFMIVLIVNVLCWAVLCCVGLCFAVLCCVLLCCECIENDRRNEQLFVSWQFRE